MLTGELSHKVTGSAGSTRKHGRGDLRSPKEVAPRVPEELNAITVRLLDEDSNRRYPDAASLISDLERARERLLQPATTRVLTSAAARARAALKRQPRKTKPPSPPAPRPLPKGGVGKQRRRGMLPLALFVVLVIAGMLVLQVRGFDGTTSPPATPRPTPPTASPTPRPDPPAAPSTPVPAPSIPPATPQPITQAPLNPPEPFDSPSGPGGSRLPEPQVSPSEGSPGRPQGSPEEIADRIEKELQRQPRIDE